MISTKEIKEIGKEERRGKERGKRGKERREKGRERERDRRGRDMRALERR